MRHYRFGGLFNFRDLGGYPARDGQRVAWHRLFRADGLHRLKPAEAAMLTTLGIVTVIDLRTPDEVHERGRVPDEAGVRAYYHFPLLDVLPDWTDRPEPAMPDFLANHYREIVEGGGEAIAGVLAVLAEPSAYPAVFHCAAGKDRTGIIAAIVLDLLGVDRETIVADYALSHEAMAELEAWLEQEFPDWANRIAGRPQALIEALPSTMERFLSGIEEDFGSVEALVKSFGVEVADVAALRANLLVPRD